MYMRAPLCVSALSLSHEEDVEHPSRGFTHAVTTVQFLTIFHFLLRKRDRRLGWGYVTLHFTACLCDSYRGLQRNSTPRYRYCRERRQCDHQHEYQHLPELFMEMLTKTQAKYGLCDLYETSDRDGLLYIAPSPRLCHSRPDLATSTIFYIMDVLRFADTTIGVIIWTLLRLCSRWDDR